jgi:phosphotransacetylase
MFKISAVNRLSTFHDGFRQFVTFFKTRKGTSFVTSLIMTIRDQLLIISDQFEIGDDQN